MRAAVTFGLCLVVLGSTLSAQSGVKPGDYVRLRTRAEPQRLVEGELRTFSNDIVVVSFPDPVHTRANGVPSMVSDTLSRSGLESMEVRRTTGNRAGRGAMVGAGIGMVLGFALGFAADQNNGGIYDIESTDVFNAALVLGVVGGTVGLGAGRYAPAYLGTSEAAGCAGGELGERRSPAEMANQLLGRACPRHPEG